MDNSIYIALSRQVALFRDLDVTANNIANANTTGYNTEKAMFTDYLVDDGNFHKMAFAQDISSYRDTSQGSMRETGNALDVAIKGHGYFVVETAAGERYTRNGAFQMDPESTLVNVDGYPVLDDAGQRIQFAEQDREIKVLQTGQIMVDGEERGNIGVVQFPNEQQLVQVGKNFYKSDVPAQPAENFQVLHGTLESSNVSPVHELVRLTQLSRSSTSTAKFIEVMYDLQRKASNTWTQQN